MSEAPPVETPAIRGDLSALMRDFLFGIAHCGGWPDSPRQDLPIGTEVAACVYAARGEAVVEGSIHQTVRLLVDKGLVEKHPNGRTKGHRLTEAGAEVCERQIGWMVSGLDGERE